MNSKEFNRVSRSVISTLDRVSNTYGGKLKKYGSQLNDIFTELKMDYFDLLDTLDSIDADMSISWIEDLTDFDSISQEEADFVYAQWDRYIDALKAVEELQKALSNGIHDIAELTQEFDTI